MSTLTLSLDESGSPVKADKDVIEHKVEATDVENSNDVVTRIDEDVKFAAEVTPEVWSDSPAPKNTEHVYVLGYEIAEKVKFEDEATVSSNRRRQKAKRSKPKIVKNSTSVRQMGQTTEFVFDLDDKSEGEQPKREKALNDMPDLQCVWKDVKFDYKSDVTPVELVPFSICVNTESTYYVEESVDLSNSHVVGEVNDGPIHYLGYVINCVTSRNHLTVAAYHDYADFKGDAIQKSKVHALKYVGSRLRFGDGICIKFGTVYSYSKYARNREDILNDRNLFDYASVDMYEANLAKFGVVCGFGSVVRSIPDVKCSGKIRFRVAQNVEVDSSANYLFNFAHANIDTKKCHFVSTMDHDMSKFVLRRLFVVFDLNVLKVIAKPSFQINRKVHLRTYIVPFTDEKISNQDSIVTGYYYDGKSHAGKFMFNSLKVMQDQTDMVTLTAKDGSVTLPNAYWCCVYCDLSYDGC